MVAGGRCGRLFANSHGWPRSTGRIRTRSRAGPPVRALLRMATPGPLLPLDAPRGRLGMVSRHGRPSLRPTIFEDHSHLESTA